MAWVANLRFPFHSSRSKIMFCSFLISEYIAASAFKIVTQLEKTSGQYRKREPVFINTDSINREASVKSELLH